MRRALAAAGLCVFAVNLLASVVPSAAFGPLAALLLVAAAAAYFRWKRPGRAHIVLVCACAGAALCLRLAYWHGRVLPARALENTSAAVTAAVEQVRPGFGDDLVFAQVLVESVDGEALRRPVRVSVGPLARVSPGERFRAQLHFAPLDADRYLYSNYADGVYLQAEVQDGTLVFLAPREGPAQLFYEWRTVLSRQIRRLLPGDLGGAAAAMTVGDQDHISDEVDSAFRDAGISHLLVVSGLHLSAASGIGYWLLSRRLGRRASALAACVLTAAFMGLVGLSPSVVRAGVMVLLVLGARILGEQADALTSMGLAILLLCVHNPFCVLDIGLLLSFAATLGVLCAGRVCALLRERWEDEPGWRQAALKAASPVCVSVFASLGTLPVLIAVGGGISAYSLAANLLTVPLSGVVLGAGFLAQLASFVPLLDTVVAQPAAIFCGLCLRWILAVARLVAALPGSVFYVRGAYALGVVLCLYALTALAVRLRLPAKRAGAALCALFVLCAAAYGISARNVVRLVRAGNAENAPVVAMQAGRTVVFFRGGQTAAQDVRETLAQYNRSRADLVIDLRHEPEDFSLDSLIPAKSLYTAAQDCAYRDVLPNALPDMDVAVARQGEGIYAVLDIGGVYAGVSSGKVDLVQAPEFAVYFAGSGRCANLRCGTMLLTRAARSWTQQAEAQRVAGRQVTQVLVRSGAGVRYREEQYGFQ